MTNDELENC
jgi:hypothetical protein